MCIPSARYNKNIIALLTAGFRKKSSTKFSIEVLNVKTRVKKAIILLLHHNFVKVLKDALARLSPYQTLKKLWCSDPGGQNTVPLPATIQI
jgi:hypothetical protein